MRRPVLRYFGGKYLLAPWIISHFPDHRVYVEPFGGAASVLMRKTPSKVEVWNDLDDSVYHLFKLLRDGGGGYLYDALRLTPYSRREFELSVVPHPDPVEAARRLIVRSFMGFGGDAVGNDRTGFRSCSNQSNRAPALDWINYPDAIQGFIKRLQGVVIENKNAIEVIDQHDSDTTLHYVDPPYHPEARTKRQRYKHEMFDHDELLAKLPALKGKVILSGYHCPTYDRWATQHGWRSVERAARADGAKKTTEVLWLNF